MARIILLVEAFMDSLPTIAILARLFPPLALTAGIGPVHFGVLGVIALGFGLITLAYGLCPKVTSKIGGIAQLRSMSPALVYLTGIMGVLLAIILFPKPALSLPRWIAPDMIGVRWC